MASSSMRRTTAAERLHVAATFALSCFLALPSSRAAFFAAIACGGTAAERRSVRHTDTAACSPNSATCPHANHRLSKHTHPTCNPRCHSPRTNGVERVGEGARPHQHEGVSLSLGLSYPSQDTVTAPRAPSAGRSALHSHCGWPSSPALRYSTDCYISIQKAPPPCELGRFRLKSASKLGAQFMSPFTYPRINMAGICSPQEELRTPSLVPKLQVPFEVRALTIAKNDS